MALLTPQTISLSGLVATYDPATAGGDTVTLNGDKVALHVKNGGASVVTVTITVQNKNYKDLTLPDKTVDIAAGADAFIGPLDPSLFADINGQAAVGYSASASVTIAALRM